MDEVDDRVLKSENNVEHETENDCDGQDNLNEETAEIRPKINVDDVLRELVERKSKMQSYSQFNLGAAVDDLNDEYTRAVASNSRNRTCRRELRNMDATADMDRSTSKISSQMKNLVEHSSEDSYKSVTKFDEMMKRLKATAAAHKQNIPNSNAVEEAPAAPEVLETKSAL